MKRDADGLRVAALVGAAGMTLSLATGAIAETDRPFRDDLDRRYRLTIELSGDEGNVGELLPTTLCLSPTSDDRLAVCLGERQGHDLIGDRRITTTFTLPPEEHPSCTCNRPVVLVRDAPLCWSLPVRLAEVDVEEPLVRGFVTVLEDVHDVGKSSSSCISVRSNAVPVRLIRPAPVDAPREARLVRR